MTMHIHVYATVGLVSHTVIVMVMSQMCNGGLKYK
jgi:hypothetical protein